MICRAIDRVTDQPDSAQLGELNALGMLCDIMAMSPKMELRRLTTYSITGGKPVWFATSTFQTWS